MAADTHRLVIADDHPLFRGALREAVTGLFDQVPLASAPRHLVQQGALDRFHVRDLAHHGHDQRAGA